MRFVSIRLCAVCRVAGFSSDTWLLILFVFLYYILTFRVLLKVAKMMKPSAAFMYLSLIYFEMQSISDGGGDRSSALSHSV